ncbi:MAG: hypothetical protein IT371_21740 [Deltaproteobacteria bacterium]|nr:hypothetical protein [Deltaproteobacteria bacterium]
MDSSTTWARVARLASEGHPATSLCWRGDDLVDWARGGATWTAERGFVAAGRSWGYGRLNAATTDPTGRWAVVHERTGTAGLLLRDGQVVRELHRSLYHADAYDYPVCLFSGPARRTLLAHCPDSYARLEIEDAETGERLTRSPARKEADFFHSRLAVSPGSRRLLSAGWVWHPWDAVVWFDLSAALGDPTLLDALEGASCSRNVCLAEESSAAWLDDDLLLLGGSGAPEDPEEAAWANREYPGPRLRPNGLAIYDTALRRYVASLELGYPPGAMMPVGPQHVVTFFQHPRLVSLASGKVVHEWADLATGEAVSSIVLDRPQPVLALDPPRARFAVGSPGGIDVVTIDVAKLPP